MFCTAPRVSHRRSLSPLLAIFITLFLLDFSPPPTPSSLCPYSILDCALSPFVHALLNEGHVSTCICADTIIYIYRYTFTITMIAACTDTRMGRSSIGRVASWFLFIASFRNKIASNYSVGFTGIYLRRVRITDSWIYGGWWPREVAKSVESERLSSFILS